MIDWFMDKLAEKIASKITHLYLKNITINAENGHGITITNGKPGIHITYTEGNYAIHAVHPPVDTFVDRRNRMVNYGENNEN